ncbi:hypothetical protein V1509DRAFT_620400 [Lipomyces kononenkoae]
MSEVYALPRSVFRAHRRLLVLLAAMTMYFRLRALPYSTILQAEFPRVGNSAIHEDALEVIFVLSEKHLLGSAQIQFLVPPPYPLRLRTLVHLIDSREEKICQAQNFFFQRRTIFKRLMRPNGRNGIHHRSISRLCSLS